MSYQHQQVPKKIYDGKTLVPLSVTSDILEIRKQIESNHQHTGGQLELVYQAYKEIQQAHGHQAQELKPTCSSCTGEMNKKLQKWFKLYDQGTIPEKAAAGAYRSKPLKPLKKAAEQTIKEAVTRTDKLMKSTKPTSKPVDTIKESDISNINEKSYAQLLKEFEKKASKQVQKTINSGKKPKKVQIIEYFNNPKKYEAK